MKAYCQSNGTQSKYSYCRFGMNLCNFPCWSYPCKYHSQGLHHTVFPTILKSFIDKTISWGYSSVSSSNFILAFHSASSIAKWVGSHFWQESLGYDIFSIVKRAELTNAFYTLAMVHFMLMWRWWTFKQNCNNIPVGMPQPKRQILDKSAFGLILATHASSTTVYWLKTEMPKKW